MTVATFPSDQARQHEAEAVLLLQQAVRVNTVSRQGDEHVLARLLADRMEREGIDCTLHPLDEKRVNLIARLRSSRPGPCVILTGHMDTVPVGSVVWEHGAFDATIVDGKMYGRGTVDMKSGLLALMFALIGFARRPRDAWCGEIIFAATSTEETGAEGAKAMIENQLLPAFDAMIVAEPTDFRLVVAHKGALWTRICSCGRASHSSMPDMGVNAINKMFSYYSSLSELDLSGEPHGFLSAPTFAVTMIQGGKQANVIPDRCELTVDMRTLPRQSHEALTTQLQSFADRIAHADPQARFEFETLLDVPAVETDPGSSLVTTAQGVLMGAGLSEDQARPRGAQYFTDASVLQRLGKNIIVLGPGDPRLAHQVNEHVAVDDYIRAITVYEEILEKYLT